ncbi:hypothetical protein ACMD2_10577 [Ananas comosus]|uniref:Uncharacterized protein n=1 Tax=Ananas comosus TaxID=4615 RepID=A0A199V463_ANACO|nr:hypothetical protein ACMD2_10577 [Ananas comosus]
MENSHPKALSSSPWLLQAVVQSILLSPPTPISSAFYGIRKLADLYARERLLTPGFYDPGRNVILFFSTISSICTGSAVLRDVHSICLTQCL